MSEDRLKHAREQGEGQADTILELYRAWRTLEDEAAETVEYDNWTYEESDALAQKAQEEALSVEVRADWHSPGDESSNKPTDFRILLSTGGPACQLTGELDEYAQPCLSTVVLQVQDWGTAWTDHTPTAAEQEDYELALEWFLCQFYYGQG